MLYVNTSVSGFKDVLSIHAKGITIKIAPAKRMQFIKSETDTFQNFCFARLFIAHTF
jgi:hypothetical protein